MNQGHSLCPQSPTCASRLARKHQVTAQAAVPAPSPSSHPLLHNTQNTANTQLLYRTVKLDSHPGIKFLEKNRISWPPQRPCPRCTFTRQLTQAQGKRPGDKAQRRPCVPYSDLRPRPCDGCTWAISLHPRPSGGAHCACRARFWSLTMWCRTPAPLEAMLTVLSQPGDLGEPSTAFPTGPFLLVCGLDPGQVLMA